MAAITFIENYYSYQGANWVPTLIPTATPDEAVLSQINTLLTQAGTNYAARHYQMAIAEYQQAESLIFQHLDPSFGGGSTVIFPHDPALFDPLLSASIEWLNKLSPVPPVVPVASRLPVNQELLGVAGTFNGVGLHELIAAHNMVGIHPIQLGIHPIQPVPVPIPVPAPIVVPTRSVGVLAGGKLTTISWTTGDAPPIDAIRQNLFTNRTGIASLAGLINKPQNLGDVAMQMPHDYFFVIPVGLGDCYHQLGDYTAAEQRYFQAANYPYLNTLIEVPFLWQRLAQLYLDWGNSLYRNGDAATALTIYEKVVMHDATVPATAPLYTTNSLSSVAVAAKIVITQLQQIVSGQVNATTLNVNPLLAAVLVEVYQQELKILGGLDFLGIPAQSVPIWTFDYLQAVAANFAQLAISAERDVINFWDRSDQESLARDQLSQTVAQSAAEVNAAQLQSLSAGFSVTAYQDAQNLAQQRATDAQANAADYASQSSMSSLLQAVGSQVSGGDNGDFNQLNTLADQIKANLAESNISRGTLAAADQLAAARTSNQYDISAMNRDATELGLAATQASDELTAAGFAAQAAQANLNVAQLHQAAATQNLNAFDAQTFTPGVWHQMGAAMMQIYQRYLQMALFSARLMQQAYNFETDQSLQLIKTNYATAEIQGLLGADVLMADIQSFTYDLITGQKTKPQPMRQTISLATRYAFDFEKQFRATGEMSFETRIDDFDAYYPGTYAGRIEAVEVEVDGIVPVNGISGTLTNSGISGYRLPSQLWTNPAASGLKYRVQPRETLVLSDYTAREDGLMFPLDPRRRGIFTGAGVTSSWNLSLPKATNDIDYGALTDVRITFYYQARFDPTLRDMVLQQLATRPGINSRQRALPMRWLYPDAFFAFRRSGTLNLTLAASDFRANETKPVLSSIGVLITTDGSVPATGVALALSTPGHAAAISALTDATGSFSSAGGNAWGPLAAGSALGTYQITLPQVGNVALVKSGTLDLSPIVNMTLLLAYSFTPKA